MGNNSNNMEQSAETVKSLLDSLEGFEAGTISTLCEMPLDSLSSISEATAALWAGTTTTHPHLFPSANCWTEYPPSTSDLILSTLDFIANPTDELSEFSVYQRGDKTPKDFDARLAIAQLVEPSRASPVHMIGFKVPELEDRMLKCPVELSAWVEPYGECAHQLLVTPKWTMSDLHVDAADGLSVPMGACKKVWVAFPPTPNNLTLLAKQEGRKMKIRRIGNNLEGGVIFKTTSEDAVYLPVGCIHIVFTTVGGFLNALDFTTPESVGTYPTLFLANLDRRNSAFNDDCLKFFHDSLELALDNQKEQDAIAAWIVAQNSALEYGKANATWKTAVLVLWNDFLQRKAAKKVNCPCGKSKEGEFVDHFQSKHLWAASSSKSPQRSKPQSPKARSSLRGTDTRTSKPEASRNRSNTQGESSHSSRLPVADIPPKADAPSVADVPTAADTPPEKRKSARKTPENPKEPSGPKQKSMSQRSTRSSSLSSNPEVDSDTIVVEPTREGLRPRGKRSREDQEEEEEEEEPAKQPSKKTRR